MYQRADEMGISRSAVSRHFIKDNAQALAKMMARDFTNTDSVAIYVDGIIIARHHLIAAVGVGVTGAKHESLGCGPFSVMHRNASGGVISLTTERGTSGLEGSFSSGNLGARRAALKRESRGPGPRRPDARVDGSQPEAGGGDGAAVRHAALRGRCSATSAAPGLPHSFTYLRPNVSVSRICRKSASKSTRGASFSPIVLNLRYGLIKLGKKREI